MMSLEMLLEAEIKQGKHSAGFILSEGKPSLERSVKRSSLQNRAVYYHHNLGF